jgi:hypothetical protein
VLNAPFNNISVIPWPSVLLVEKTTDVSQVTDKYYRFLSYFLYYNNLNSSKHKKGDQEVKYYFFKQYTFKYDFYFIITEILLKGALSTINPKP